MAAIEQREIFACSSCHKRFNSEGFKVNRLGIQNKTCLECAARRKSVRHIFTLDGKKYIKCKSCKISCLLSYSNERECPPCYGGTLMGQYYDVEYHKQYFKNFITEELMKNRFHPLNHDKLDAWGFSFHEDDE